MLDESKLIDVQVKDNKVHVEHKDPVQQIKKKVLPTGLEAQQRAEQARKDAHTLGADLKREISMEIKNKLSESFDFIEESCGSGSPEFEFYAEPKMVSEGVEEGAPSYPIIGRASGVFAPIGVMSRNNRIYDNDHYDYLLENQQLVDRIAHRGMLGTIGHHDKKVDDQDLAEGKVSHIVTNLRIVEEADGSRNLYGVLEILDTPAGHLLKTYYDSGVPLFVSSRGGGNLLPVPNESYKRVDKTKYFLETFDIVKNPGFLQAKPVYEKVSESVEETVENQAEEIVEEVKSEDKLDKLIESVSSLVSAISEGDKKVVIKQEDGEKKETKETKEAKEAKETKIVEEKKDDKKDKEEDKPEDEKNDDAESAVASSVTEEENSMAGAIHNAKMAQKADQERAQAMKELKARATKKAETPQKEYVQKKLFDGALKVKEESEYDKNMRIANDYDKQFMREPATSPDGSANSVANYYQSKYQEYFDKAMAAKQKSNPNNGVKPTTPVQKASAGKMNYMNKVHDKMNDKNSKIEQAIKTIDEADQVLAQPIVAVQNAGNSTKSAQEANPEVKEPVTMDRLELARALKAKVNNDKKVEV